jgi:hypothetical protein
MYTIGAEEVMKMIKALWLSFSRIFFPRKKRLERTSLLIWLSILDVALLLFIIRLEVVLSRSWSKGLLICGTALLGIAVLIALRQGRRVVKDFPLGLF